MTITGSMPCHIRWLGSRLAPITGPTASRSLEHGFCIIYAKTRMQLQCDLIHSVAPARTPPSSANRESEPHSTGHRVPLRKSLGHGQTTPVGVLGSRMIAWAAGKRIDLMQSQFFRQKDRVRDDLIVHRRLIRIWMNRIAMRAQGRDLDFILTEQFLELRELSRILQQLPRFTVFVSGNTLPRRSRPSVLRGYADTPTPSPAAVRTVPV